jgi:hypothetical protein
MASNWVCQWHLRQRPTINESVRVSHRRHPRARPGDHFPHIGHRLIPGSSPGMTAVAMIPGRQRRYLGAYGARPEDHRTRTGGRFDPIAARRVIPGSSPGMTPGGFRPRRNLIVMRMRLDRATRSGTVVSRTAGVVITIVAITLEMTVYDDSVLGRAMTTNGTSFEAIIVERRLIAAGIRRKRHLQVSGATPATTVRPSFRRQPFFQIPGNDPASAAIYVPLPSARSAFHSPS